MIRLDRRILTHFDFFQLFLIIPIIILSYILVSEVNTTLAGKQIVYFSAGFMLFCLFFLMPIRRLQWIIPTVYWFNIVLLVSVEFFGISKLGAQRWLDIPFVHFTLQPSEMMKPALLLMLAYLIKKRPPDEEGYNLKEFLRLSFYILLPFVLIAKEPDLGTALILLLVGYAVLFVIGVNKRIWITIFVAIACLAPVLYENLHDYQKKRILDFISEKPSYHVRQSIIAIGSGGLKGKPKDEATQTHFKFLPIATSDFIFAYTIERFGFYGALGLLGFYGALIAHLLSLNYMLKNDHFTQVMTTGIAVMIFIYVGVNISMTIGFAPVVGVPLPFFSYGGTSFVTFMVLFGMLENLLTFRYDFAGKFLKFQR
ncbi:FtsW/RodA/SpoVE family cell cycle protein [Campylobacter pinnipediorum]|uniref:Rod shape-determining protein n=2 Tax=Campylobacter pinnipediorum TaxID=1965231 RepID=A0A1S6U941_9BACT|nr:FtsW/RodA/SpoVE family cell cycle protein [Campylobacter pinnipediorum]AQW81783.1 rod shape-determining protein [Campylobacter pinnipediorum subsp. pinnipediorum]AQW83459.1 rod shape-determining protein [Campylobacter pinnipediorum subsp. pinnipediorum]AQW84980.1 rod shape-determining protein [Campylobacter pinnipediorum subsp. pinnipediorum]AQW86578.1 rod shape-determining protein [Campylobacter pinnipediorum subsp. caledonicus]AQW88229.1 rod shape-determining protein [Campylobacter pinnip